MSDLYPTLSLGGQTPVPNDLDQNIIVPPLQSFSQWSTSAGSNINDPLLGAQGYADYQRGHFFRTGELDDQVESSISQGLVGSLLNNGIVSEEEVQSEGFLSTLKPQKDAQTQTNLIRMAYGEEAGSIYFNNIQSEDGNKEELGKQLNRAKTLLVESGSLPFARVKDDKGVEKIIGGIGIEDRGKALDDSVRLGALDYSDAYRVMSGLKKGAYENTTVFESIRQANLLREINDILGSEDPADDIAQNALDNMRELVKQNDIKPDQDQSSAMGAVIGDFRKGLSSSYSRKNGFGEGAALNRYSDKEIKDTVELLAASEVNDRSEFKLYDEDAKNIRILGSGHVLAHPSLMQQRDRFERAISTDKRLSPNQVTSLRNQRKLFRQLTYEQYDKFLADTAATSDDWMAAKQAGRVSGASDTDVLDTFLADKRNYSSIKNRLGDVAATIPDSVIGLFASLGSVVFKSEGATNYLVENQMDRQRRREVASLFGDDFGWGMDLSNVVAPMVVDVSATLLLSSFTVGTGGVAYAATKSSATSAAKLAVKNLSKVAAGRQFGDTAKDIALAAAARKELKGTAEKASFDGVQDALKAYNKAVGNKMFRKASYFPATFLPAANRSAGSTYATVYAAQPDNMTHEEKHDAALGYAMMAGTVTGLITTAFMGVGLGGFESAFLKGMTTKGMLAGLEKIGNLNAKGFGAKNFKADLLEVVEGQMKQSLKGRIGNNLKSYGIPAMSEALEEGLDEFVQTFIMDAALNEETPMIDRMMVGLHAASIGGVMGAGVVGVRSMMDRGRGARFERLQEQKIEQVIQELGETGSPLTQRFIEENKENLVQQLRTAARSREIIDVTPQDRSYLTKASNLYESFKAGKISEEKFISLTGGTPQEFANLNSSEAAAKLRSDERIASEQLKKQITEKLNKKLLTKEEANTILEQGTSKTETTEERESQSGSLEGETLTESQLEERRTKAIEEEKQFVDSFGDLWMNKEESMEKGGGLTAEEHHQRYKENKAQAESIASFWGMETRVDYDPANKAKGAVRAEKTNEGMRLVINPWGMSRLTMGLSRGNAQHVIRFEAAHETIHHSAWRNLSKAEMDEIFASLPATQVNEIIDTYYEGKPESIANARALLAPDASPSQQRNMHHIVVDEFLRMKAQRLTKGFTSEEELAFYRDNPNFLRVFMRYLRSYVNRFNAMREKDSDNPVVGAALNRLAGEMARLKGGFEVNPIIKFDIDDPESSLNILATYIDDKPFVDTDPDKNIVVDQRESQAGALQAARNTGYTVGPVYHGTNVINKFNVFESRSISSSSRTDVGFHFGTKQAAKDRIKDKRPTPQQLKLAPSMEKSFDNERTYSVYLKAQNPLRLDEKEGSGGWGIAHILSQIFEGGDILPEFESDADAYFDGNLTTEMVYDGQLREMEAFEVDNVAEETEWLDAYLNSKGYDSVVYKNRVEDKGNDSYIVFNPNNIKLSDPVTKDDKGNVIPLSQRFDPTNPDIRYSQAGGLDRGNFETDTGGIGYGSYTPLFELPFFKDGEYKGKSDSKYGMIRWFVDKFSGTLDPRVKRLVEQRRYIREAVEVDIELFKKNLEEIIKKDFNGNAPTALIQDVTGSKENITPETSDEFQADLRKEQQAIKAAEKLDRARKLTDEEVASVREAFVNKKRKQFTQRRSKAIEKLAKLQNFKGDPYQTDLVKHLLELRKLTDELSERIKSIVSNSDKHSEIGIAISDNLNIYLHKTYKLFTDKEYEKNVRESDNYENVRNAAGDFLLTQYKTLNPAGYKAARGSLTSKEFDPTFKEKLVNDYLDIQVTPQSKVASSNLIKGIPEHKKSIINLNIGALKKRKNPPKELRDLLGEASDDTGYNELLKTFSHLGLVSSHINFIQNLKDVGQTNGFIVEGKDTGEVRGDFSEESPSTKDMIFEQDSDESLKRLEITAGKDAGLINAAPFNDGKVYFVNKEMDQVVQDMLAPKTREVIQESEKAARTINRIGASLTGLSLGAKTLGSFGFYVRNIVSNVLFFGPSQGFIRADKMGKALVQERIRKKYLMMGKEEVSAFHRTMIGLGIGGNSLEARLIQDLITNPPSEEQIQRELLDNLEGLEKEVNKSKDIVDIASDKTPKAVKKLYNRLREMSQSVDTFYKIAYFMNELDVLQQARAKDPKGVDGKYGGMSDEQLMQDAARKVKATSQQYDQAPPIVQRLQETWLGVMFAPFVRFKIEVWRIAVNTISLIKEEKQSGNPVLIKRGKQRAYGFWGTTIGASAIAPIIVNALSGIGEEEDEALRDSMPEYLRSHSFFYIGKGDKLKSVDFTYLNPYAMIVDPLMRGLEQVWRGSPAEGGSALFKALVMEQYLDEQILAGAVSSALNNRDPETGLPIVEANDTVFEAFSKKLGFVFAEAYAPRTPTKFKEGLMKLTEGDPDVSDFITTPIGALVNELMPMKPYDIKLDQQLDRFLSERSGEYRRVAALKNRMYTDDSLSEDMVRGFTDEDIEKRRRINAHLIKTFRGFKKLGLTDEQIYNQALNRGYGKRRMALLLNGLMERPALQTPFIKNMATKGDVHIERLRTYQNQLESYGRYIPVE